MSLADFLFTPGMQRVLATTLLQPDQSFSLQDLLRAAASGRGSAQQQIERLIAAGVLVEEARRGKQRSIRANAQFVLYPELLSIARKTFAVIEPLKEALAPFAAQISDAFVFGSVAKRTDNSRSDIDLIIVGQAPLLALTESLHTTEQALGRPINFSVYEPKEWDSLIESDPIMGQIAKGSTLKVL